MTTKEQAAQKRAAQANSPVRINIRLKPSTIRKSGIIAEKEARTRSGQVMVFLETMVDRYNFSQRKRISPNFPPVPGRAEITSILLRPKTLEKLELISKTENRTRSAQIRLFVEQAVHEYFLAKGDIESPDPNPD